MLQSYFANGRVSMTKEKYFEMCEMMGTDPIDEEIPIEFDDFPIEAQEALRIYNNLQDSWDYMNGNYIGKNLAGVGDIFDLFEIPPEDKRATYELIMLIDRVRAKNIEDMKANKPSE